MPSFPFPSRFKGGGGGGGGIPPPPPPLLSWCTTYVPASLLDRVWPTKAAAAEEEEEEDDDEVQKSTMSGK